MKQKNGLIEKSITKHPLRIALVIASFLLLSLMQGSVAFGQTQTLLSTGFESSSFPSGWTQDYVSPGYYGYLDWYPTSSNYYQPTSAHSGSYWMMIMDYGYYNATTKLITPAINFGIYKKNPKLKFWHHMRNWGGDQDNLKVYYRTSSSGSWTLLTSFTSDVSSWTERTIDLENVGSTYYIAFEAILNYGYGVHIDDVTVTGEPELPDAVITNLISPTSPFTVGIQTVQATLKNLGSPTMTSCNITWSVNGVQQGVYNWSGTLAKDATTDVTLGTYNFSYPPSGPFNPFSVTIQTSSPNGGNDGNPANDLFIKSVAPILNDAGPIAISGPPQGFSPGMADVYVKVKNFAPKPLSSITINWEVDGVAQNPKTFTGLNVANGSSVDLVVGQYNFGSPRLYTIKALTSFPNGVADEIVGNDSYTGGMGPSLGPGFYTIGGVNPSFATFAAFISYLGASGIIGNGDMNVEIRPGVYTAQYSIGTFPRGNNTINIYSQTNNAADVIIDYAPSTGSNYVFNGTNLINFNFRNVTFRNNSSNSSFAGNVLMLDNCTNINFNSCAFVGPMNPTSANGYTLVTIRNSNSFNFDGCTFSYGATGLDDVASNTCGRNVAITKNIFQGQKFQGIYSNLTSCNSGAYSFVIKENAFRAMNNVNPQYGVSSMNAANDISHNTFSGITGSDAIYVSGDQGSSRKVHIHHNIFTNITDGSAINAMYVNNIEIHDNDIQLRSQAFDDAGIKLMFSGSMATPAMAHNNTIYAVDAYGIYALFGYVNIYNNYINSSSQYGQGVAALYSNMGSGQAVQNQIIGNNTHGATVINPMGFEMYYNSINCLSSSHSALNLDDDYGSGGDEEVITEKKRNLDEINGDSGNNFNLTLKRNLIINSGGGFAINVLNYYGLDSDENNLFTSGSNLTNMFKYFSDWQYNTGQDRNSANVPVLFKSSTDLHLATFNESIVEYYPLFLGTMHDMYEIYDWDLEPRGDVYYYGVDHIQPIVTILEQPTSVVACANGTTGHAQFLVVASVSYGAEPRYQWYKDGEIIPGATQAVYIIDESELSFDHSGVYSCAVSGTGGAKTVYSEEVLLYVLTDPEITKQPQSVVANAGETVMFEVQAHVYNYGDPIEKLNYQWYRGDLTNPLANDDKYAGADASILIVKDIQTPDYGNNYFCVVSGRCGSVQTEFAGILLPPDVNIVANPAPANVCEGLNAIFSVNAQIIGGGTELHYQWMKDGVMIADDAKYSGTSTNTLTVSNLTPADAGKFSVKVTVQPGGNTKTSTEAELTIKLKPTIVTQPEANLSVQSGRTLSLTLVASGNEPFQYQWYKDGAEIANETSATFTVPTATFTDAGTYTCKVNNECGEIMSNESVVTVTFENQTSVSEVSYNGYRLFSAEPNPVKESAIIRFVAPTATQARLILHDMFGKEIVTLLDGTIKEGNNEARIDLSKLNLASGVYYYTLTAKDFSGTLKMMIVK